MDAQQVSDLAMKRYAAGHFSEAAQLFARAIELAPNVAEYYSNLGSALRKLNDIDNAIHAYECAMQLNPNLAAAHLNLANILAQHGRPEPAMTEFRKALQIDSRLVEGYYGLGNALWNLGRCDEAMACYKTAIQIHPDSWAAHISLANALKSQGRMEEAIESYRRGIALNPRDAAIHSNLCYAVHFAPSFDAVAIYREQIAWNQQHAEPLKPEIRPHENSRDPVRRLRIGYVSPNLNRHVVGRFLLPLLEHHDRDAFEIFAFSDGSYSDEVTFRVRAAGKLVQIGGVPDGKVADRIRQHRIDILVDLTMHMYRNRLLVFARKPAPVQVTYLAYCSTTGLDAIDYRITDPWIDPPGTHEQFYSERSIRLPQSYWCFAAPPGAPGVSPPPSVERGFVTFGCMNNFTKLGDGTLQVWATLLKRVPQSRLVMQSAEGKHCDRVREMFAREGVDRDRLKFGAYMTMESYFAFYREIDIALDPLTYAGGMTTCDALWMGVPVVTLPGETSVSRSGASILNNVGLGNLVARSIEEYLAIGETLARDPARLGELRSTMRARMQASPLMDAPRFARNMEVAFRTMWQNWCKSCKP